MTDKKLKQKEKAADVTNDSRYAGIVKPVPIFWKGGNRLTPEGVRKSTVAYATARGKKGLLL